MTMMWSNGCVTLAGVDCTKPAASLLGTVTGEMSCGWTDKITPN